MTSDEQAVVDAMGMREMIVPFSTLNRTLIKQALRRYQP